MASLKVINYKFHFLNRKLFTGGILPYFCHQSTFEDKLNVCRQTGVGGGADGGPGGYAIHLISIQFACLVLRKVHVHSLFTLKTVGFPEYLLFLDSDKQLNQ